MSWHFHLSLYFSVKNLDIQIQIQIQKKVYCHKYINIHNIHKQIYSDNEGNEADAYLPLYGEWDQLINSVMAYSL